MPNVYANPPARVAGLQLKSAHNQEENITKFEFNYFFSSNREILHSKPGSSLTSAYKSFIGAYLQIKEKRHQQNTHTFFYLEEF